MAKMLVENKANPSALSHPVPAPVGFQDDEEPVVIDCVILLGLGGLFCV